jgi:hypothetical protein
MKKRIFLALCVVATLALCIAATTGRWQKKAAARQIWEYKLSYINLKDENREKELNKLGADGWELVMAERSELYGNLYEFYFKRPK